jgi:hypothetical protein
MVIVPVCGVVLFEPVKVHLRAASKANPLLYGTSVVMFEFTTVAFVTFPFLSTVILTTTLPLAVGFLDVLGGVKLPLPFSDQLVPFPNPVPV